MSHWHGDERSQHTTAQEETFIRQCAPAVPNQHTLALLPEPVCPTSPPATEQNHTLPPQLPSSYPVEEEERCTPDRSCLKRQFWELGKWHLHWLFDLAEIQIEHFI